MVGAHGQNLHVGVHGILDANAHVRDALFDSLSDEQRIIHASSAKKRKEAFVQAILASTLLVAFLESSHKKARV